MKILITGFSGFVGKHFLDLINTLEPGSEIAGIDKHPPDLSLNDYPALNITYTNVDLLEKNAVEESLASFRPEYILHLAAVSSVAQSWKTPVESFVNNTSIFLNIVDQARLLNLKCRILSVGSSEEFGEVTENQLPLTETHALNPLSPYAVARVSQEFLSRIYAKGFSQDIVMTRSFNHIGPGQKENFVVSSFTKQLVLMSRKQTKGNIITTGDLEVVRDFVDVRDVVRAYYLLLKKGRSGEIYNVCSGKGIQLKEILAQLAAILGIDIQSRVDPNLIRPNENKKVIGSYEKIKNELDWNPEITMDKSLNDIVEYWQEKLN